MSDSFTGKSGRKDSDVQRKNASTKMNEYLAYIALMLKEQGATWPEVHEEINRILVAQGKEPVQTLQTIVNRATGFRTRNGNTFAAMVVPYLTTLDKLEVMKYLLGDLLIRYERAKVDNNTNKLVTLSSKVQELIWKIHQMEKGEDVDGGDDAFTELIKKSLERDGRKFKQESKGAWA